MQIINLAVHRKAQRQGLGKEIMTHMHDLAIKQDVHDCFLEVRSNNSAAKALYLKTGYETVGLRKNYYLTEQGREDALVMRKQLSNNSLDDTL